MPSQADTWLKIRFPINRPEAMQITFIIAFCLLVSLIFVFPILFAFHYITKIFAVQIFFTRIALKPYLNTQELRHPELDSCSTAWLPVLLQIDMPATRQQKDIPDHVHPVWTRRFQAENNGIYRSEPYLRYFAVRLLKVLVCLQPLGRYF